MFDAYALPLERLAGVGLRGLLLTLVVSCVLLFGLLLYHLMAIGGAIGRLGALLAAAPGDAASRALILCLPLGAFFEAVSGFGVGIVIVGPLLVSLGFSIRRAALLSLLTQNAVPWGALAVGIVLSAELSGIPAQAIGLGCGLLFVPLFPYFGLVTLRLAGGWPAVRAHAALAVGLGLAMAGLVLGVVAGLGVELGGVVAGPIAAGLGLGALHGRGNWTRPRFPRPAATSDRAISADPPSVVGPTLVRALGPYGLLVGLLMLGRLVPPLRDWLATTVVLAVPAAGFTLPLLFSPGFSLAIVCLATVPMLQLSAGTAGLALARTGRQWLRASLALAAFMILSELMLQTGMTDRLAGATAAALGGGYILAAPAVGALSGFLTGSNAGGSAMLLGFQLRIAEQLGVAPLIFAASQNAAAGAASLAAPQRIVLATTIMGLPGEEGRLMRAALAIECGVVVLLALGVVAWLALGG